MKSIKGQVFTSKAIFEYAEVIVEGSKIIEVRLLEKSDLSKDEQNRIIIPGLVDIHMHGAAGYDVCRCDEKGLQSIADYERKHGITSLCFATMTLKEDYLTDICSQIHNVSTTNKNIKGIYLEGPFINEAKTGAQNANHICKPDYGLLERLQEKAGGLIKLVTVAPEIDGFEEFADLCKNQGESEAECVLAVAHSAANTEEAVKGFEHGISHVTHLYNAMNPMTHREPGIIGTAADRNDVTVELICDGYHVDPVMIRNTFKLFGKERIVLVSDSIEATGMSDGEYMLGDKKVVKTGNKAILADSKETLAGSVTNLFDCMINAIHYGIAKEDAICSATINPAKRIGIYEKAGSIESGKVADLLILTEDYSLLKVVQSEDDLV